MLESEFEYYLAHQAELAREHEGKFLVIKDQNVIGVYDDEPQAMNNTLQEHELGSFLVQKCSADRDSVVLTYHSRMRPPGAQVL